MKLRNQIIVVNVGIAAGLGVEAARGAPLGAVLIAGVALYFVANVIFWNRIRKIRRVP